jgi:hypothetical protein
MGSFHNPFKPRSGTGYIEALANIRRWASAAIANDDALMSVTESACPLPDCPPRETIILIMPTRAAPSKLRIHKAMADVTEADVLHGIRSLEKVEQRGNAKEFYGD